MAKTPLDYFIEECHENLVKNKPSHILSYLQGRGIIGKTILDHKVGYCASANEIPDAIKHFGKENPDFEKGRGYSYFIENKIILPIYDEFGETVGLATRPPANGKDLHWWNLPFTKGNHVFLLNRGRGEIFKRNKIYIMEGYMDGLVAFQKGLYNVGVIMGTALTRRKIGLIARYCEDICFCFDTDENKSGQKATMQSILMTSSLNFCNSLSTVELPMGEDPASFLLKNNVEDFLALEREITEEDIEEIKEDLIAMKGKK
jgi:DNA primase